MWGSLGDAEKHLLLCLWKNFKKREAVAGFTGTKQCFLVPVSPSLESSSSHSPHPLLRVPHPISKSIKCVCEAEEAHQLTTAPPPFFPPLLAATEPRSPSLACRTTSSTPDPASAIRQGMRGLQWGGGGGGGGGPCPRSSDFYLWRHNKRDRRQKENPLSSAPASASALSPALSLLSPFQKKFMGSSCFLSLPHSLSPPGEKVRREKAGCLWIIAVGNKTEKD